MSRVTIAAAALAVGVVLAGCGPGRSAAAPSPTTAAESPAPSAGPPAATTVPPAPVPGPPSASGHGTGPRAACMKPYAAGNQSRSLGGISGAMASLADQVSGLVVQADWNQLEPGTPGRYDTAVLDKQIAYAKANGLSVRIRVTAGVAAPDYVKKLGGPPIPFYDHQQRRATTIGRFWRTDYQSRWQALMTYLATRFDADPTVREVNISGTGTISSETMLTFGGDRIPGSGLTNGQRMLAAGATEAQRRAALMADISFMQRTWTHTHTTLFAHPYVSLDSTTRGGLSTTEDIITATYDADPGATVFGHTGASATTFEGRTHSTVLKMYTFLISHHYPFMAQTQAYSGGAKNEGVGSLRYVMSWLAAHGAYSIELPSGWQRDPGARSVMATTSGRMSSTSTTALASLTARC